MIVPRHYEDLKIMHENTMPCRAYYIPSCHLLQAAGKNILIDCGMEQGPDLYENPGLPIAAGEVDYVFLTHAHIDHSGLLPLLCKNGFKGQILTTFATADLCNIMLRDSAHIQEFEAEWRNRLTQSAEE